MSLIVIDMLGEEDDVIIISNENSEKDKKNSNNEVAPQPELQLEIVEIN